MVLGLFHIKSTKESRASLNYFYFKIGTHIGSLEKPKFSLFWSLTFEKWPANVWRDNLYLIIKQP